MTWILALPLLISFLVTYYMVPRWIKRARHAGLEGKDMNKYKGEGVAEAGGVNVVTGFLIGVMLLVAIETFYFKTDDITMKIFVLTTSVMIMAFIGMIDDILGWKIGLGKRLRLFLVLIAAIPLMVINAGESQISIFGLGVVNLGLIYPLLIVPLGILGAGTTFNFLAGYNGLEAGQGIIIISALSAAAYFRGVSWLALAGMCFVFALVAFLKFNMYPAKVFPGDVLTYPLGAMIAIMAILGDMERIAIFFFIPYIIETALKSRGKLLKQSYGKPNKDGSLEMPYDKIYGLEHVAIWILKRVKRDGKVYEKDVVYLIHGIQIIIILIGFWLFRDGIFG
jgi:UDP-N-acetylglucosamine--dolichyl-phosphate N-acetylglucosaminephosphotransferase